MFHHLLFGSPYERCYSELFEDCDEDSDDSDYLPSALPQCKEDVAIQSCADFGSFSSVTNDFPSTCENLRALDSGLGIRIQ